MPTQQCEILTQDDGRLLIRNAELGVLFQDDSGYNVAIKETATGFELTVYDASQIPTVYTIEDGQLQTVLEIVAKVNGVENSTISDELAAANFYPEVGQNIKSSGNSYLVIAIDADPANKQYIVYLNDLGRLTIEGQISGVVNAALTAELEKLGRFDWTEKDRIGYNDGTSKTYEVLWAEMDTENKKYIVNVGALA